MLITYALIMSALAFLVQFFVIVGHWRFARTFGWMPPLVLSAIAMTTMMLPRLATILYTEGILIHQLTWLNNINSTIYLFDSILFFLALWSLTRVIYAGRLEAFATIRNTAQLQRLSDDMRQMNVGFQDYWQMAESIADGIVMIDESSRILYVNEALCKMLGYTKTQLAGESLTVIMPERFRERHLASFGAYLATGTRHINWERLKLVCLKHDQNELPVEISFASFRANGHRRFVGSIRERPAV